MDGGDGIWDFQHCTAITRGQEGRIPKTANVMGTNIGLRSFSYWFSVFIWFSWILEIWGKCAVRVFHLSLSFYFLWNVVDSYFFLPAQGWQLNWCLSSNQIYSTLHWLIRNLLCQRICSIFFWRNGLEWIWLKIHGVGLGRSGFYLKLLLIKCWFVFKWIDSGGKPKGPGVT